MPTVTISGNDFTVYADVATADAYAAGSISDAAEAFRSASDDTKKRALVSATRWLDELSWKGDKADADQAQAWPRTGTGVDGVEDDAVPSAIVTACIELAVQLVADPDLRTTMAETSLRRMKAGSVEMEYFRGSTVETRTPLPKTIMGLVKSLLARTGAEALGALAYGTDRESAFDEDYGFSTGL